MIVENQKDAEFSSTFRAPQSSQPAQASRFKRWLASVISGIVLWVMMGMGFALGDSVSWLAGLFYENLRPNHSKTLARFARI